MDCISRKAPAKIDLGLDVLCRRPDGYHEVKMVMQTVDICDTLTFKKTQQGISIQVDAQDIPNDENNLIYKAAKLFLNKYRVEQGVAIVLNKVIPVAAGMAGGSTDAAATLLALNDLFEIGATKEELMELSVAIGADVPFCIMGGTALSEGIGEKLTALSIPPECYLLIAKPDIYVSTKYVYENLHANQLTYHPDIDGLMESIREKDLTKMCEKMENVLETVTIKEYPIIEEWKQYMKKLGAVTALMSGSGPTVFGVFEDKKRALKAYEEMRQTTNVKQIFVTSFYRG